MTALGDGVDPHTDRNTVVCDVLNLDPTQTTAVRIELEPGNRPVVHWEGARRLTNDEFNRLVAVLDHGVTSREDSALPTPGPDPWGTPPDPPC